MRHGFRSWHRDAQAVSESRPKTRSRDLPLGSEGLSGLPTRVRPGMFLHTNVCIDVANRVVPEVTWSNVLEIIRNRYTYFVSLLTALELINSVGNSCAGNFTRNRRRLKVLLELQTPNFLAFVQAVHSKTAIHAADSRALGCEASILGLRCDDSVGGIHRGDGATDSTSVLKAWEPTAIFA